MAMRNVVSAVAGLNASKTAASANVQEALRMNMVFLSTTIGRSAFGELQGYRSKFQASRRRHAPDSRLPLIVAAPAACGISRRRASPVAGEFRVRAHWRQVRRSTNKIRRASCRDRVEIAEVAVAFSKK